MKMTKNIVVLFAAVGTVFSAGNARAGLNMTQREAVQDISWSIEILAILAALVIAVFVWRLSKRDQKSKDDKRHDLTRD
jgi:phosphate/sulfate permease